MAVWRMPPPLPKPDPIPRIVDFVSEGAGAEVLRVTGCAQLAANLLQLPLICREAACREMAVIAHEVIETAKATFVPIDTGDLKDSGDSDPYMPGTTQEVTDIAMWFGGEVGPEAAAHGVKDTRLYALEQHENMEYNHHGIGGPKYLETPFNNILSDITPRIARAAAEAIGLNPNFIIPRDEEATSVDPNEGGA